MPDTASVLKSLIIFVKNPEAGKVKTRLAKDIGESNTLTVYKHLLGHTRQISSLVNAKRLLFYADKISWRDEWPEKHFNKFVQQGEDLGLRMLHAFQTSFKQGNNLTIIIGSDCIDLSPDLIEKAFLELQTHDFVVGPAKDGGYYLLGMKYPEEKVFKNKAWSTGTVCNDTISDIKSLSKTFYLLNLLSDVDTIADMNEELRTLINPL